MLVNVKKGEGVKLLASESGLLLKLLDGVNGIAAEVDVNGTPTPVAFVKLGDSPEEFLPKAQISAITQHEIVFDANAETTVISSTGELFFSLNFKD